MQEIVYWPGQTAGKMAFSPGGISLTREGASIPTKRGKGNKIDFLPVHVPPAWAMQMLRAIEQLAAKEGNASGDYFLNAPFLVQAGELVITEALISEHAAKISITKACTAVVGVQTLPFLDDHGGLIHVQKEVVTVTTYGKVVLHIDLSDNTILLAFEVSADVERRYASVTVGDLVAEARAVTEHDHFRLDGVIVFPKGRRGSNMMAGVFATLEATYKHEESTEYKW